jgi:hypothetical protein
MGKSKAHARELTYVTAECRHRRKVGEVMIKTWFSMRLEVSQVGSVVLILMAVNTAHHQRPEMLQLQRSRMSIEVGILL